MENFQTAQDFNFSPPASVATSDMEMRDSSDTSIPDSDIQIMRRLELPFKTFAPWKLKGLTSSVETPGHNYHIANRTRSPTFVQPDRLTYLPPHLIHDIFSYLNVADSVCLGLTHPSLYAIHFSIRGPIKSLYHLTSRPVVRDYGDGMKIKVKHAGLPLHWRIRGFMKELVYFYCYESRKFVQCGKGWLRDGCNCEDITAGRRVHVPKLTGYEWLQRVGSAESIVDTLGV